MRVVIIYKTNIIASISEDVEKLGASLVAGKQENWWCHLGKKIWQFYKQLPNDPAVLLQGTYARELKQWPQGHSWEPWTVNSIHPSAMECMKCGIAGQWLAIPWHRNKVLACLQRGWPLTIMPRPHCMTPCIWNLRSRQTVGRKTDFCSSKQWWRVGKRVECGSSRLQSWDVAEVSL